MRFDEMGMDLRDEPGAALLAYADKSVRDPANRLSTTLSREISDNWSAVMEIQRLGEEIRRLREETKAEDEDFIPGARLIVQKYEAEIDLGQHSTLDVDEIDKLCDNILDAARKDLRGS
jgi:hypothetical protein